MDWLSWLSCSSGGMYAGGGVSAGAARGELVESHTHTHTPKRTDCYPASLPRPHTPPLLRITCFATPCPPGFLPQCAVTYHHITIFIRPLERLCSPARCEAVPPLPPHIPKQPTQMGTCLLNPGHSNDHFCVSRYKQVTSYTYIGDNDVETNTCSCFKVKVTTMLVQQCRFKCVQRLVVSIASQWERLQKVNTWELEWTGWP